jgi:hypothetical protein
MTGRIQLLLGFVFGVAAALIYSKSIRTGDVSPGSPTALSCPPAPEPSACPSPQEVVVTKNIETGQPCTVPAAMDLNELELPPPRFVDSIPDPLTTNAEGEVYLKWTKVNGARSYLITIEDKYGKVAKKVRASNTAVYLKELPRDPKQMEGELTYFVKLSSLNLNGKPGRAGEPRTLVYKAQAPVLAPQIKTIKVLE